MGFTVVADIGGTSSRWGVLRSGSAALMIEGLPGYNPAVGDPATFIAAVGPRFHAEGIEVADLFAYGAGCGSPERALRMADVLLSVWPHARVDVASDLMGTAHGLLGDKAGFVLILGTGMNAGWYDGAALHLPMPSLGYILGDEGSGADIAKHAVADALHGRMPKEVMERVFPDGLDMPMVVQGLYKGNSGQSWLASFTAPLASMVAHPYVRRLFMSRFSVLADVLSEHFTAEQRADVFATGSVVYGLRALLQDAFSARGMRLSDVQPSPLPGLLRYRSRVAR